MINSGAILLASLIVGNNATICTDNFCQWLNKAAQVNLFLDPKMLKSVQSKPNLKNQALIQEMVKAGHLKQPDLALDTYNQICCLSGTVEDLAKLGLLLMNEDILLQKYGIMVQEMMLNCGLYESSEGFKNKVGFPTKSGVSGAVLSLIPEKKISLAYYSPPLDKQGNSVAALYFIDKIWEIIYCKL
jgi:glutaminase